MGYSLTWVAVRGMSPEQTRQALGLQTTGATEEIAESPVCAASLPDGWYLVVSQRDGLDLLNDRTVKRLFASQGASSASSAAAAPGAPTGVEVVVCSVEEHVMASFVALWRGGERIWSVDHSGESRIDHLEVAGAPPAPFQEIRDRLTAQQQAEGGNEAEVDLIFDIPLDLAAALTGFRHDQDLPGAPHAQFEVLQSGSASGSASTSAPGSAPARPWWKRLLGG